MSSFMDNPNWGDPRNVEHSKSWERGLPVHEELTPMDQPLITPVLAGAFGISDPSMHAPGTRESMYPPGAAQPDYAHHQHHMYQQPHMNLSAEHSHLRNYPPYDSSMRSVKYPPAMPGLSQHLQHHTAYPYHSLPHPSERDAMLGHGHHPQHTQHMPQTHQQMPQHGFPGVPPDRGDPFPHHPGQHPQHHAHAGHSQHPGISGHPRISGHHPPPRHLGHNPGHNPRPGYLPEHPHEDPHSKGKKRGPDEVQSFSSEDEGVGAKAVKRPRLVWTPQLHKRFVDAVSHLGIKNSVPKTIMQLMNVEGLTRENVASHLQKYRLYLKRMQQSVSAEAPGMDLNLSDTPSTDITEGSNNGAGHAGTSIASGARVAPSDTGPSSSQNRSAEEPPQRFPLSDS